MDRIFKGDKKEKDRLGTEKRVEVKIMKRGMEERKPQSVVQRSTEQETI